MHTHVQVGRVEATIRKVTLAACYGLLKAGAVEIKVTSKKRLPSPSRFIYRIESYHIIPYPKLSYSLDSARTFFNLYQYLFIIHHYVYPLSAPPPLPNLPPFITITPGTCSICPPTGTPLSQQLR